jgi:hypothetical protein
MKLLYCTLLRDAFHSITFHLQSQLRLYYWYEDDSDCHKFFVLSKTLVWMRRKRIDTFMAGRGLVEGYSTPKISVFGSVCLSADRSWRVEGGWSGCVRVELVSSVPLVIRYSKLYYTCSNVFKVILYLLYLKTFFGLFRAVALSSSLHTSLSLSTLLSISLHQGTDMCQLATVVLKLKVQKHEIFL